MRIRSYVVLVQHASLQRLEVVVETKSERSRRNPVAKVRNQIRDLDGLRAS